MFKIGDKVRISKEGRATWQDSPENPHKQVGRVYSFDRGSEWVNVVWKDTSNTYTIDQLELASEANDRSFQYKTSCAVVDTCHSITNGCQHKVIQNFVIVMGNKVTFNVCQLCKQEV